MRRHHRVIQDFLHVLQKTNLQKKVNQSIIFPDMEGCLIQHWLQIELLLSAESFEKRNNHMVQEVAILPVI